MTSPLLRTLTVVTLLSLAAACSDREVSGPSTPRALAGQLTCQADVRVRRLSCGAPAASSASGASGISADLVLGGGGVALRSSNVGYDAGTSTFRADVTVQNLTALPLGTPDGSTVSGVRVFFSSGPNVVEGAGTVTVRNDSVGTFTGTNQPYFRYDEILQPGQVSAAKTWEWTVPSTVASFKFAVLVAAPTPQEQTVLHWTTKAAMPTARYNLGAAVINGMLYAVGGSDGNHALATLEAYDPATDTWTTKAPMPTARWGFGVGVVNGILYAVGGDQVLPGDQHDNGPLATVEAYDPATDTWTTKASMPWGRWGLGVAVIDGILYAVGGTPSPLNLDDIGDSYGVAQLDAYDPATNTWTTKASMSRGRIGVVAGALDGLLYAVGGWCTNDSCSQNSVDVYDPTTSTWQRGNGDVGCGGELGGLQGIAAINGVLHVVENGGGMFAYDPHAELPWCGTDPPEYWWVQQPSVPTPRSGFGVAGADGMLYVVGGQDSRGPMATVEAYRP